MYCTFFAETVTQKFENSFADTDEIMPCCLLLYTRASLAHRQMFFSPRCVEATSRGSQMCKATVSQEDVSRRDKIGMIKILVSNSISIGKMFRVHKTQVHLIHG